MSGGFRRLCVVGDEQHTDEREDEHADHDDAHE
jgi:hypothetical protein